MVSFTRLWGRRCRGPSTRAHKGGKHDIKMSCQEPVSRPGAIGEQALAAADPHAALTARRSRVRQVEPAAYRAHFGDHTSFDMVYDMVRFREQVEKFEPGVRPGPSTSFLSAYVSSLPPLKPLLLHSAPPHDRSIHCRRRRRLPSSLSSRSRLAASSSSGWARPACPSTSA